MAARFCDDLLAIATIVVNPPPLPGTVPDDPDDDMIVASAVAASADYIVSRDAHLHALGGNYGNIKIAAPESFIRVVRQQFGRLD